MNEGGARLLRKVARTIRFGRRRGWSSAAGRVGEELADGVRRALGRETAYERWFAGDLQARLEKRRAEASEGPLISVVVPVCDPAPQWLAEAIESVRAQTHSEWQLCLVDDASTRPAVLDLLSESAAGDARIELATNASRRGIAASTNVGLGLARGRYVAFLDHDDRLTPDALACVAEAARSGPFDVFYSDEDKLTPQGRLRDPTFKPARSSELLRSCMYFGHLTAYRRAFIDALGGLDPAFDGSQDWDLALRAEARAERIVHHPAVLYHWRMAAGSTADPDGGAKPWAYAAGRRALEADLARREEGARVEAGPAQGHWRVVRRPRRAHRLTLVAGEATWGAFQQVVGEASDSTAPGVEIQPIALPSDVQGEGEPGAGVAARWNEAARAGDGDLLLFLGDVSPSAASAPNWLAGLVAALENERVGVVGGRILSRAGRILHLGVVTGGPEGIRTDPGGWFRDDPGPLGIAQSAREVSAVTGGLIAMPRVLFDHLGGFDEGFRTALHDVDFCLRSRALAHSVLYQPAVECVSHVSFAKSPWEDHRRLVARHADALARRDPFSHPGFTEVGAVFRPRFKR